MAINNPSRSIRAEIWLTLTCVIWGASFPLVKIALNDITPLLFLSIRFWLGALLLCPVCAWQKCRINRSLIKRGSLIGVFLFFGMLLQTLGLQHTTASNSGFITGMAVIIVPVLVVLIEKRRPSPSVLIGVAFACAGIALLTQPQSHGINKGDIFTLIGALSFSFEIIYIEIFVRKDESLAMAWVIVLVTAILATMAALCLESVHVTMTQSVVFTIVFVSVFCTAVGFTMQTFWQPKTTATAAAVIFTAEPVFAAIFAWVLLYERMNFVQWSGAGLILTGMLVTELRHKISLNHQRVSERKRV